MRTDLLILGGGYSRLLHCKLTVLFMCNTELLLGHFKLIFWRTNQNKFRTKITCKHMIITCSVCLVHLRFDQWALFELNTVLLLTPCPVSKKSGEDGVGENTSGSDEVAYPTSNEWALLEARPINVHATWSVVAVKYSVSKHSTANSRNWKRVLTMKETWPA